MDYRAGLKNKIGRQTKLIDPTLSNEQLEDICNDPDVYLIFKKYIE